MSESKPHAQDRPVVAVGGLSDRYAQAQAARYDQTLQALVVNIHRLAEEVECEGQARMPHLEKDGHLDYAYAANRVLHSVMWGLANLNLDGFTSTAQDAHNAVRGRVK